MTRLARRAAAGPSPCTSSNTAGMISATTASSSISAVTFAAVRSKYCRSRLQAADEHRGAHDEQDVAEDRADQRRLDDLLQALVEREEGDDQLGRVAERDVQEAADARARARRELLGRAAHQRRGRDHAERRGDEDQRRRRVRELEHDRDRDERDEQVRPARPAQQEPAQVEALRGAGRSSGPDLSGSPRRAALRHVRQPRRSAHLRAFVDVRRRPSSRHVGELLEVLGRAAAPAPPDGARAADAEPAAAGRRAPSPPSWPSSSLNGLASCGSAMSWSSLRSVIETSNDDGAGGVAAPASSTPRFDDHPAQDLVVLARVDLDLRVLDRVEHLPLLLRRSASRAPGPVRRSAERGGLLERRVDVVEQLGHVDAAGDLDRVGRRRPWPRPRSAGRSATCAGPCRATRSSCPGPAWPCFCACS